MKRSAVLLTALALAAAGAPPAAAATGDFDGDGFADTAIGAPGESLGSAAGAGAGIVHVLYGSASGISTAREQVWSQNSTGVSDAAAADDGFGESVAAGDFDDDGRDDLVISAPGEDIGGVEDAGTVHVLYGSAAGLTADESEYWAQHTPGVAGSGEAGDRFGSVLEVGHLDSSDRYADLVIGVPREDLGETVDAGSIHVIRGVADGLTGVGTQYWSQRSAGVSDESGHGDGFGAALAVAQIDGEGGDDLAIGVPGEDLAGFVDAGVVHLLPSGEAGATAVGQQFWHQGSDGIANDPEARDAFGASLAAGDFDRAGRADLAIGAPGEDVAGTGRAGGVVHVVHSGADGLSTAAPATAPQLWSQNSAGISDAAAGGDRFGAALAAGDVDAANGDDLVAGAPGEGLAGRDAAGAVHVIRSGPSGLAAAGEQLWHQDASGVPDAIETGDQFGSVLSLGQFDGASGQDLLIGAPAEDVGAVADAGIVQLLRGGSGGVTATGQRYLSQNVTGVSDAAETADGFGTGLP